MSFFAPAQLQRVANKAERRAKQRIYADFNERIDALTVWSATGRTDKARKATYRICTSRDARIWGLMKAGLSHMSLAELTRLAESFHLAAPFKDEIQRIFVPKCGGRWREINILPVKLKAAHYIVGSIVGCQVNLADHVYSQRNRGRDALVQDLIAHRDRGYHHIAIHDIPECFSSVNPEILETLPLHKRFVNNSLRLENLEFADPVFKTGKEKEAIIPNQSSNTIHEVVNSSGPRGIMQGSPASWAILSRVWEDLPPVDPDLGYVLVFVDDVVVAAKSASGLREINQAVAQFLLSCPAGPLALRSQSLEPGESFEFLGYEIGLDQQDASFEARLSHRTFEKLSRLLPELVEFDRQRSENFPYLAVAQLAATLGGHRLATDSDDWFQIYLEDLLEYNLNSSVPFT